MKTENTKQAGFLQKGVQKRRMQCFNDKKKKENILFFQLNFIIDENEKIHLNTYFMKV